ncbi:MAG TPA: GDSL-type esterase/lipase family protein [Candidatus Paceibacterota bacterium]|jgi:lysophospholipase L1-like esterase
MSLRTTLMALGGAVLAALIWWGIRTYLSLNASKQLIEHTRPFERLTDDTRVSLLVLGDSTAVGVGATLPEESVPGRVAAALGATYVENHAVIGAVTADLADQVKQGALPAYDFILIQIGANDMVRFHDAEATARALGTTLASLPPAGSVVVISAGDLGTARLFPYPLRVLYTRINREYHQAFGAAVRAEGATYVDLSKGPGVVRFEEDPTAHFAADNFHLSSRGYGLWFEAIRENVQGL